MPVWKLCDCFENQTIYIALKYYLLLGKRLKEYFTKDFLQEVGCSYSLGIKPSATVCYLWPALKNAPSFLIFQHNSELPNRN